MHNSMAHPHSKAPPPRPNRAYPRTVSRGATRQAAPGSRDVLLNRIFNNRFRIQQLVARGGMGKVYRATQVPLGRTVALKVLNPTFTAEQLDNFQRRFFLEAAIAARLSHPNTVTVFDFGKSDDDIFYIAMEYLQGVSLRTALQRDHGLGIARSLHIAMQIGNALREAHQLGAVHRDLKPANVFLVQRGEDSDFVKVLDFGLVKHIALDDNDSITQPGKFLGSPGYMAPEQIRGKKVDARCDIYALGVLLYEMLAGTPPFVRTGPIETMMAHVHDPVPSLCQSHPTRRIPLPLAGIVERCLEKDPAARHASMDALLEALTPWAAEPTLLNPRQATRQKTPVALDDAEGSGWSVVSSTGILARPRPPMHHKPPPPAQDAASCAPTQAMHRTSDGSQAPTVLLDTSALPTATRPRRASRPWHRWRPWSGGTRGLGAWAMLGAAALALAWYGVHDRQAPSCLLTLRSQPQGAQAWVDDTLLCDQTPCQVLLEGDVAKRGHWLRVRFAMSGFDEFVSSRAVMPPEMEIAATLDAHH